MGEIERHPHAAAPRTRHGSGHGHRRPSVAVAALVIGFATAPVPAADDPPTSRPTSVLFTTPVDLRVDRAPIALVLGQLAATAGLDRVQMEDGETARVTGPLAGSLRAVLAGLVADHDLVLDVADGTLDARSEDRRRTVVLDTSRPDEAMYGVADLIAAALPGNVVASSGSTLVVSGHPAFVARIEGLIASTEATGFAVVGDLPTTDAKPSPETRRETDPTPMAAATPPPGGTASAARPAGSSGPSAPVIRSIEDIPGFY